MLEHRTYCAVTLWFATDSTWSVKHTKWGPGTFAVKIECCHLPSRPTKPRIYFWGCLNLVIWKMALKCVCMCGKFYTVFVDLILWRGMHLRRSYSKQDTVHVWS